MINELCEFPSTIQNVYIDGLNRLKALGVTYISFALDIPDHKLVYFSNNDWLEFYVNNRLDKLDPVRDAANNFATKYIRWDTLGSSKLSKELMQERENICDIYSGFSIITKAADNTSIFSVATAKGNREIYNEISHNLPTLIKINRIFRQIYQDKFKSF